MPLGFWIYGSIKINSRIAGTDPQDLNATVFGRHQKTKIKACLDPDVVTRNGLERNRLSFCFAICEIYVLLWTP